MNKPVDLIDGCPMVSLCRGNPTAMSPPGSSASGVNFRGPSRSSRLPFAKPPGASGFTVLATCSLLEPGIPLPGFPF